MECVNYNACDDGDVLGVLEEGERFATKVYKCYECGEVISVSEAYYEEVIKNSCYGIETYRTCGDCKSIRDAFFKSWWYGLIREDFYEYVRDCDGDLSQSKIAGLTPGARGYVCGVLDKYNKNNEELKPYRSTKIERFKYIHNCVG